MKSTNNLNDLKPEIIEEDYYKGRIENYTKNNVAVCFQNIEGFIIDKINEADAVTGCIAWMTNFKIIEALSKKEQCQIIVQKEDFLRPDNKYKNTNTKPQYYEQYLKIKGINKYDFDVNLNVCNCSEIDGVRCVGISNLNKSNVCPRMHNKFIILYKHRIKPNSYVPYAIITGSFNYTHNGGNSFENVMYIKDKDISNAYRTEYEHILSLSENLNWNSEWVEPEYRFGT